MSYREPITFREVSSPQGPFTGALTSDLSAGGLRLNTARFTPKDSRLLVLLSLPGLPAPMRIISRVAWVKQDPLAESYDCGLQFSVIASKDRDTLAGYVERGVVRQVIYS